MDCLVCWLADDLPVYLDTNWSARDCADVSLPRSTTVAPLLVVRPLSVPAFFPPLFPPFLLPLLTMGSSPRSKSYGSETARPPLRPPPRPPNPPKPPKPRPSSSSSSSMVKLCASKIHNRSRDTGTSKR